MDSGHSSNQPDEPGSSEAQEALGGVHEKRCWAVKEYPDMRDELVARFKRAPVTPTTSSAGYSGNRVAFFIPGCRMGQPGARRPLRLANGVGGVYVSALLRFKQVTELRKSRKDNQRMLETRKTPGNTKWFVHDRFGMFIHWGLYSMAARHEWVRHNEQIPEDVYDSKYFKRFDPD